MQDALEILLQLIRGSLLDEDTLKLMNFINQLLIARDHNNGSATMCECTEVF